MMDNRHVTETPMSAAPRRRRAFRAAAATTLLGLAMSASSLAEENETEPPPDPLAEAESAAPGASGYFGGGSVPPSLLTPSRLTVGDFALSAQTSLSAIYDDNVEADDDARDEDIFLALSPSIRAQSLYARHSLGFGAGATAATALKDSTDDFFDWRIGTDGRLDLSRRSRVDASLGYSRDVEDDESVDAEDDDGDVPIHSLDAGLGFRTEGDRLGYGVSTSLARLDVEGGDFDDRDNTTVAVRGDVRLKWSDALTFSAGPGYRRSIYDDEAADDGESRDATRLDFRIGAGYRASRTIQTRASIGYAQLHFDDPDREDEDTATAGAGLIWSPGAGTTLDLQASRSLGISIVDDEDSRVRTSGTATLTHRLALGSRSAITSSLSLGVSRYSDFDRTDKTLAAGLTYGYRLTGHAYFTSSYRFSQRDSDDEAADYYRNLISLGVTLRY